MENYCLIKEDKVSKQNIGIIQKDEENLNQTRKRKKIKYTRNQFKNKDLLVINKSAKEKIYFKFDKIFTSNQKSNLYKKLIKDKIANLIEGKNSIFLFFSNFEDLSINQFFKK